MIREPGKHFRIWKRMAAMSLSAQLSHGLGSAGFLLGKLIRLGFFFAYLLAIFRHTDNLAGYSAAETALFFLTFNVVDIAAMILFRGIYAARRVVEEGDLDYYLVQPCSPLFRMTGSSVDFVDAITFLPVLGLLALTWPHLPPGIGPLRLGIYLLLLVNAVAIAFAMHVLVAALAVWTQELNNTIWIYREMMFLGKFPMDIYAAPLRWAITFVLPIGVMVSFPAKALLGSLGGAWTGYALLVALVSVTASVALWRAALANYTSVSS